MTDSLPQPCARWADLLAAPAADLSAQERRALDAHLAQCQACAAVRADYQRMQRRIRSLPDPRIRPGFPPWLLALQADEQRDALATSQILPFHSTEHYMQTRKEAGMPTPAPTPFNQGQHPRRRVVSWVTAVAALVVIALITAALLASHGGTPATTGHPGNTTTPSSQGWHSPPGLARLADQPFIAPSNPQVIYLVGAQPTTLRRTNDGGAHWQTVSLPQGSQTGFGTLLINADNAQNIFALLSFPQSSSQCSGSQASAGSVNADSGYSCEFAYYSVDGGVHWGLMRWSAQSGKSGAAPVGEVVAQGSHLYSVFYDPNENYQLRLIMSADDGATWQFADETLRAQGQGMCSFTAAPTGTSVFALVQAGRCTQPVGYLHSAADYPQAQSEVAVWRTDDAGAHWTEVNAFPFSQPDTSSFMAVNTGGAQATLFAAAGQGASYARYVSTDGGKTWQPLPTQGLPAGVVINAPQQTTLSDGSVLMIAQSGVYAWKPGGQTWRRIAPPMTGFVSELAVASAAGHDTLWAVISTSKSGGSPFSVLYAALE